MEKLILTDVDDTLLYCSDAIEQWMAYKGFPSKNRLRDTQDMEKTFNISSSQAGFFLEEFCQPETLRGLQPYECAAAVLPALKAAGHHFIAITACGDHPLMNKVRRANLKEAFGFDFEEVHCCPLGGSKFDLLRRFPPSIWVDDIFKHAVSGHNCGHKSFLINRFHNADNHHAGVTRVDDWNEIEHHINKAD